MTITYPGLFPESLCTQLNHYFEINHYEEGRHLNQRVISMKKLIENKNMQIDVFPKLLRIQSVEIPKTTLLIPDKIITNSNIEPIFLYLHFCVDLYNELNHINPISKTEHTNLFKQAVRAAVALEESIKNIQKAGISHTRCFVETSLEWQIFSAYLEIIKKSGEDALKLDPVYAYTNMTHDNIGMSQKTEDFKDQLFIYRLSEFTQVLFKKPLYGVVGIIATTLLGKGFNQNNARTEFNEDNVRILLAELKKRKI